MFFFLSYGENCTPTPVTLEFKIKEVFNLFSVLSTVCGGRSQLGLNDQFELLEKQKKEDIYFELILSLSESLC